MKKSFITLFVGLLIISSSLSAQSFAGYMWQLQNPTNKNTSELMGFDTDYFTYMSIDLATRQTLVLTGTYKISSDKKTIELKFETGEKFTYQLTWWGKNKATLENSSTTLLYVKFRTREDRFMEYRHKHKDLVSEECSLCLGSDICQSCQGTGIYISKDFTCPCAACGATGKCWHFKK
jgi:hypothetical protein